MAGPQRRTNNEQVLDDFNSFPESFSPPVYNQERMNNFNETFGNLADATLDEALAAKVIRDVIRKNNLTEDDISIESLRNGTAPILDTFTFQNKRTKELFPGTELSPEQRAKVFSSNNDIFEYFARSPSGEKITPGRFGEGIKSRIIPAAVSFPSFFAGAKATNYLLSGLPPTTPLTAGIRIVAPVVGGIVSSIAAYKPAQTANDYIFGEADVYLPDQANEFRGGQSFMEGLGWLGAPYAFKANIGANLVTNFAESRRLGPRAVRAVEKGLSTVQAEARQRPIRTAIAEVTAAGTGAAAVSQADADTATAEFLAEVMGASAGGIAADAALNRLVPTVKKGFAGLRKLKDRGFRGEMVDKATTKLGDRRQAELGVYALETIATVEDPDEIYRRLKWYKASRDAVRAGKPVPQGNTVVIEAKGVEGETGYVPPVTEADLFEEFGDIITETIDPTTGQPVNLPTALASNSLGFMLLQQASSGQYATPQMQRRINQLSTKGDEAYSEFRNIMLDMIKVGFASEDKDMIGNAAELASRLFASDLQDDLAVAVNKYTDARKRLLKSDDPADILRASQELQKMILTRLSAARANEKKIWQAAPDFDVRLGQFTTENGALNTITLPNGDVVNAPNFVSNWLSILQPLDKKDRASFLKDPEYSDLNQYVMDTLDELGYNVTPLADRVEAPEIENAQKAFDKIRNQVVGNDYNLRILDRLIAQGEEMSTQDAVRFWRDQGLDFQENASDFENPTLQRRIGRALEARANLQILRNNANAAAEDAVVSESISSRTMAFRRSKLLAEAKVARNAGNEQKAKFLGDMAASFLDDLDSADTNVPEYHLARAYSRSLNDAFTRPFTGKIAAQDKSGAYRIAPESVIDSVFNSTFASERARAIDALGKFEITQSLTNLLNLAPEETSVARDAYLSTLSELPSNQQAEIRSFAEQVNSVEPAAGMRLIDQAMAIPDTPAQELQAYQALKDLHEATHLATGQNLESADAGLLLDQIRQQAFDTESGFINLPKLQEILAANSDLLDNAPILKEELEKALSQTTTTRGVMETSLRKMRDFGFDSEGKFSRASLERWMESAEARGLLQAFPDMQQDLQRIIDTNGEYLKVIQDNKDRITNAKAEQNWFYLLKEESKNPDGTLNFVAPEDMSMPFEKLFMDSQTRPAEMLNRFWKVAKNAPATQTMPNGDEITKESVKRGFKTSLIGSIMNMAGMKSKDKFSALKAHELFFKPLPRSDSKLTLSEWVIENDVMTKGEVERMNKLLTRIGEIDMLAASGKSVDVGDFAERMGTSIELLASALGSATASKLYRAVGGDSQGTGSLAVVTRGSTAAVNKARQIMSDMPAALKADFFINVLESPDVAIDLLEKAKTVQEKNAKIVDIVNYFASRGFLYLKQPLPYVPEYADSADFRELTESERREQNLRGRNRPRADRAPMQLSPQPSAASQGRNVPPSQPVGTPTTQAALPAPQPPMTSGAGTNPQLRQQYAALFPNDPISGMLVQRPRTFRRGGIASLME